MRRKLLQQELAHQLGVSPAMVSRLKRRGMPVHSVAAAVAWRNTHLDPTLLKGVRRGSMPPEATAGNSPELAIVRKLAELAAINPDPWISELRLALEAVPPALRDQVELTYETWDALLAYVLPTLEGCAAVSDDAAPPQSPEDERAVGRVLYALACGHARVND